MERPSVSAIFCQHSEVVPGHSEVVLGGQRSERRFPASQRGQRYHRHVGVSLQLQGSPDHLCLSRRSHAADGKQMQHNVYRPYIALAERLDVQLGQVEVLARSWRLKAALMRRATMT